MKILCFVVGIKGRKFVFWLFGIFGLQVSHEGGKGQGKYKKNSTVDDYATGGSTFFRTSQTFSRNPPGWHQSCMSIDLLSRKIFLTLFIQRTKIYSSKYWKIIVYQDNEKAIARARKDFLIRHHLDRTTGVGESNLSKKMKKKRGQVQISLTLLLFCPTKRWRSSVTFADAWKIGAGGASSSGRFEGNARRDPAKDKIEP